MKFENFVKQLNCEYSLETFDNKKIIRIHRIKKIEIDGIKVQIPNDMAFYFEDDFLTSSAMPEEVELDINQFKNSQYFTVENNELVRKKI